MAELEATCCSAEAQVSCCEPEAKSECCEPRHDSEAEFRAALEDAGFGEVEIRETHRVHEDAAAAIVRARKPE